MLIDLESAAAAIRAKRAARRAYRAKGRAVTVARRQARQLKAAGLFGMGAA
jgi:hypothetical protein